jgi:hypothetical protein
LVINHKRRNNSIKKSGGGYFGAENDEENSYEVQSMARFTQIVCVSAVADQNSKKKTISI